MYYKNLKSFRISLFVLVTGFFLTACDLEPNINFPDMSEIFYNAYHGYYGKVIDNNTKETISDAKIVVNERLFNSNSDGFYEINNLPENFELTIKVSKEGYQDYIQTVRITSEEAQELNIFLLPTEKSL